MLCENFKSLYELFDSNLKNPNNELFDFNKDNLSKVYFYTMTLIDGNIFPLLILLIFKYISINF